jgi:hypothetical protein
MYICILDHRARFTRTQIPCPLPPVESANSSSGPSIPAKDGAQGTVPFRAACVQDPLHLDHPKDLPRTSSRTSLCFCSKAHFFFPKTDCFAKERGGLLQKNRGQARRAKKVSRGMSRRFTARYYAAFCGSPNQTSDMGSQGGCPEGSQNGILHFGSPPPDLWHGIPGEVSREFTARYAAFLGSPNQTSDTAAFSQNPPPNIYLYYIYIYILDHRARSAHTQIPCPLPPPESASSRSGPSIPAKQRA